MTFGFPVDSKNFCKLPCVSWEVFVLHGYDCVHCVVKSCTTIAYRWLFRDSHPFTENFVIGCNQINKNNSVLGTTVPVRFLQEALVILVVRHISQFRSFGKWIKMLCLPDTTFALRFWQRFMRRTGSVSVFWNTFIYQNSCSHSGRSCDTFPCSSSRILTSCCCWMFRVSHDFLRWRCTRSRWKWSWRTCR